MIEKYWKTKLKSKKICQMSFNDKKVLENKTKVQKCNK